MSNNDLLIKLYDICFDDFAPSNRLNPDIVVRKPIGTDRRMIVNWATQYYPDLWLSEIEIALANTPRSCFIAQQGGSIIGFACYDATALGYFGPIGVTEAARGKGIGRALTISCLHDMWLKGYGYAIVGMADSADFYRKIAPVIEIPGSTPGIYRMTIALSKN